MATLDMVTKSLAQLWTPKTRILNMLSLGLVAAGMISWIRFIGLLESQALYSSSVPTGAFLNSIGFLFLASQLSTVGVAFYAYSLSAKRATEWERQLETAVEAIQAFIRERKELDGKRVPVLDMKTLKELASKKTSRTHIFVMVEALGTLLLYGWLVAEFQSNVNAREWARQSAPWAFYLLNEYSLVLFVGVVAGITVSGLVARRSPRSSSPD